MKRGTRGGPRGRGGISSRGRGGGIKARLGDAAAALAVGRAGGTAHGGKSWHKVQLTNGAKYDAKEILKILMAASQTPFIPVCYTKMVRMKNQPLLDFVA